MGLGEIDLIFDVNTASLDSGGVSLKLVFEGATERMKKLLLPCGGLDTIQTRKGQGLGRLTWTLDGFHNMLAESHDGGVKSAKRPLEPDRGGIQCLVLGKAGTKTA